MFDSVFDLLAPACCHGCGATGADPLCADCAAAMPWNRRACLACALPLAPAWPLRRCPDCLRAAPPQDTSHATFTYRAPVTQWIVGLKFHGQLAAARVLGRLMADRLAARPAPLPDLLLPVPLHPRRLQRRGYNQALEIARHLARRLAVPLQPELARRRRATAEQTRLDAGARQRNLARAFTVSDAVRGRHVALLDDVMTTGTTLSELARTVRAAGAARIEAWVVARVPPG